MDCADVPLSTREGAMVNCFLLGFVLSFYLLLLACMLLYVSTTVRITGKNISGCAIAGH